MRPRQIGSCVDECHCILQLIAETERAVITKVLEATRWNRTAAAKQLGLTLRQLRYRLEKLGIE